MTIKAILMTPGEPSRVVRVAPTLKALREAIGGGWLEALHPTVLEHGDWCAYVDEEGALKRLPSNPVGTTLLRRCGYPAHRPVYGPVLIVGVSGGREVDVPGAVAAEVLRIADEMNRRSPA